MLGTLAAPLYIGHLKLTFVAMIFQCPIFNISFVYFIPGVTYNRSDNF